MQMSFDLPAPGRSCDACHDPAPARRFHGARPAPLMAWMWAWNVVPSCEIIYQMYRKWNFCHKLDSLNLRLKTGPGAGLLSGPLELEVDLKWSPLPHYPCAHPTYEFLCEFWVINRFHIFWFIKTFYIGTMLKSVLSIIVSLNSRFLVTSWHRIGFACNGHFIIYWIYHT